MSRIRLESCSLEIDGRSLLTAKPKARVRVNEARLIVPLSFVAAAVRTQLPGWQLALPDGADTPRVDFAGEFEVGELLPNWAHELLPDSWQGPLGVDGTLELRTTPGGRLQVVVIEAAVAGVHLPKALNIQRRVLEHVRRRFLESPLLRKGSGDSLFELDLRLLASKLSTDLELPASSSVAVEGDDVVVSYGASASALKKAASASKAKPPAPRRKTAKTKASASRKAPASKASRKAPGRKVAPVPKAVPVPKPSR